MGFSDAATPCLWVGNIKAGLQQRDVTSVFSSFGAIRRVKLGPAPPGTSATGLAAEVHFASVAQAAAALTALNAIVVPRLSGHHPLAIQCWQPSGSAAPASHTAVPAPAPMPYARPTTAAATAAAPPAAVAKHAAAAAAQGPQVPPPDVRPLDLAEASAAVELPGAEDLRAALAFFEGCSFLAVPEEERGSAAKWAVLQALLARGLRHLGGCTFRQLPVLLTQVGDELLKHRGSNPAVEAEYQSYPAAARLTSLVNDIRCPGLVSVTAGGSEGNTKSVQLHLAKLALAGGSGAGGAPLPAKPRPASAAAAGQGQQIKPPPPNQYTTSSVPSRHLVLLGVADRADAAHLAGIARQHGTLEQYLFNTRKPSLTLHFSTTEAAVNMAREVEGQALPGLATPGPLQVEYKHLVPASATSTAGAAGGTAPKASPAKPVAAAQPAAKPGKSKAEAPPAFLYSATVPSASLRVKKINAALASRQSLAQVGQSCGGSDFVNCMFYPSTGIGYLFFKTEAAAIAAAAMLRGRDLPWTQAEELLVEFRHPPDARLDGTPSATATAAKATAAAAGGGAGAAAGSAEEAPPCCACCGASGEGVALSRCSGCRVVHYCGRDCQLKDWAPRHATECSQLRQLAAALQAAQPAAGASQAQLLVAALRSPGGREARMLRSLLGADALPDGGQTGSDSSDGGQAGSESADGTASSGDEPTAAAAEQQPGDNTADDGRGAAAAGEAATIANGAAAAAAESDAAVAGAARDGPAGAVANPDEATAADGKPEAPSASAQPAEPAEPAVAADGSGTAEEERQPSEMPEPGSEGAAPGVEGLAQQEAAAAAAEAGDQAAEEATAAAAAAADGPAAEEGEAAEERAHLDGQQPVAEAADAAQGEEGAAAVAAGEAGEAAAEEPAAAGEAGSAEEQAAA